MKLLLYLELRQLANFFAVTLRTPKRLIPAILMGGYFVFIILMQMFAHGMSRHSRMTIPLEISSIGATAVFGLMSLALIFQLIKSFSDSLLIFALSDIDYLFASPISRQAILTLKLLGLYVKVGVWGLFISLFMLPQMWMFTKLDPIGVIVGWMGFILFAAFVINVSTLINLVATYREGGKWWLSFAVRGFAYVVLLGFTATAGYYAWQTGNLTEGLVLAVRHPVVVALLFPSKCGADMLVSGLTGLRPLVLVEAVVLMCLVVISYMLVMLRPENPYEPSLSASVRRAAVKAAARSGGAFRLNREAWAKKAKSSDLKTGVPPFGHGAIAILWKNLNVTVRTSGKTLLTAAVLVAMALVASKLALPGKLKAQDVESIVSIIFAYVIFFVSTIMLQSFRGDLKQANILKPMPIPSWQVVAVQTLSGAITVAVISWTIVVLVAVTYGLTRNSILLAGALCLPAVSYAVLCWQAGVAILFPKQEDQSQMFVANLLSMFAGGLCLIPAVIIGVIMNRLHLGMLLISAAVLSVSVVMAAIGVLISGYLYSRFDPSDE